MDPQLLHAVYTHIPNHQYISYLQGGAHKGRNVILFLLCTSQDLQRMGLTWEEGETSAQDRHSWRQRVALDASVMRYESRARKRQCTSQTIRKIIYVDFCVC